jgi:hypothetical protein
MSSDDPQRSAPSAVTVAMAGTGGNDLVAAGEMDPVAPEVLVAGLRHLQRRIPEFIHLSVQEKRSHARAANLDPEFIESGLQAAEVWQHTRRLVKRDAEELRREQEESREWDQVIVELRAITDGIEAANLKRKHHLGKAILQIYRTLAAYLSGNPGEDVHMVPYYENMKSAYMRTQRLHRKRKTK